MVARENSKNITKIWNQLKRGYWRIADNWKKISRNLRLTITSSWKRKRKKGRSTRKRWWRSWKSNCQNQRPKAKISGKSWTKTIIRSWQLKINTSSFRRCHPSSAWISRTVRIRENCSPIMFKVSVASWSRKTSKYSMKKKQSNSYWRKVSTITRMSSIWNINSNSSLEKPNISKAKYKI